MDVSTDARRRPGARRHRPGRRRGRSSPGCSRERYADGCRYGAGALVMALSCSLLPLAGAAISDDLIAGAARRHRPRRRCRRPGRRRCARHPQSARRTTMLTAALGASGQRLAEDDELAGHGELVREMRRDLLERRRPHRSVADARVPRRGGVPSPDAPIPAGRAARAAPWSRHATAPAPPPSAPARGRRRCPPGPPSRRRHHAQIRRVRVQRPDVCTADEQAIERGREHSTAANRLGDLALRGAGRAFRPQSGLADRVCGVDEAGELVGEGLRRRPSSGASSSTSAVRSSAWAHGGHGLRVPRQIHRAMRRSVSTQKLAR